MSEIASASQEQSAGIEQVNLAIAQMDQVTQQNASLVEEAAGAADAMQNQAASLAHAVSVFKVGHEGAGQHSAGAMTLSAGTASTPGQARRLVTTRKVIPSTVRGTTERADSEECTSF